MKEFIELLGAFADLLWIGLIIFVGYRFRNEIVDLYNLLRQQFASGRLRWKDFEFKGADLLSFDARDGRVFRKEAADQELFDRRHESYAKTKNLFLVHRVRPTGRPHKVTQLPTYDISIYLVPHKNFGRMNDVRAVEYYLGQHFGLAEAGLGTKFIVENGSEDFAVRINAYRH